MSYLSLKYPSRSTPSKPAPPQAALPEPLAAAARAGIIAAQLLFQQFLAVDDLHAPLDVRLGREASPSLAHIFEKTAGRRGCVAWGTSFLVGTQWYTGKDTAVGWEVQNN